MNGLVKTNSHGESITTSLIIAHVFQKEHKHVLRDIENLSCSDEFRQSNFGLSSYTSLQNKKVTMCELTKDGFSFLVMGYTGDKAGEFKEQFIKEFNKRDLLLKSDGYILARASEIQQNMIAALEQSIVQKDSVIAIQQQAIEEAAPKVDYYDNVLQSNGCIPITIIAKELGMSAKALNIKLKDAGIQYKSNGTWVLSAEHQDKGWTKTKTFVPLKEGSSARVGTYWTQEGRRMIHKYFS